MVVSKKKVIVLAAQDVQDGLFWVTLLDGDEYRCEREKNTWYFSDGTGWRDEVPPGTECFKVEPIPKDLPEIKKDYNYGPLTYPLSEFFGSKV